MHSLSLDDDARNRLGGSVIVTRDGPHLFIYARHPESAQEAERVARELMEEDELAGEVSLTRWHPIAEEWRPASEPLPETEGEISEEERLRERNEEAERHETGQYPWEVVIDLPGLTGTRKLAEKLIADGLPVKRRFTYILVGAESEEAAVELGNGLEGEVPDGSHVGIRANPAGTPPPGFVMLGSLKPGVMRDLGL
jgi:hypothetical protein